MQPATPNADATDQPYAHGTWITSTNGKARASFDYIGEGYDGDYDEADPNDSALLRLDVEVAAMYLDDVWGEPTDDPDWVFPSDGSICTLVHMDTTDAATLRDLLTYAAESVAEAVTSGTTSVKATMDNLSYLPTKR